MILHPVLYASSPPCHQEEERQFQLLAGDLFREESRSEHTLRSGQRFLLLTHPHPSTLRTELFDNLVAFFPPDMTQPTGEVARLYR